MERELGERAPPMAELLAPWTEGDSPVARCFSLCLKGLSDLEERSFAQVWERAVREGGLPLREEELERLLALGQVLGRCGQESQRLALSRTVQTLTVSLTEAREEERRLGRLDFLLGGAAGLTAAILLL
jgi:stage III sporulation protein AB